MINGCYTLAASPRAASLAPRFFLVALAAAWFAGSASFAAPITLAFSAQVIDIFESSPGVVDLPFAVSIGDSIQGTFSYEPPPAGRPGVQAHELTFDIGNVELRSQGYVISAIPNQYPPVGTPLPLQPFDQIVVGCSLSDSGTQCNPGVPGNASVRWESFMDLTGDSPILSGVSLPADLSIWNQFTARGLELTFLSSAGGLRVGALVGPFTVVPEPHWQLALVGAASLLFSLSIRGGRSARVQLIARDSVSSLSFEEGNL